MKGICWLCQNWEELEEHHIFAGANRPLSTKYKATVRLCRFCHREDADAVHRSGATRAYVQDWGQRKVMREQGWTEEDFRAVFGKSYLLGPMEEDEAGEGGFFAELEPIPLPW